MTRTIEITDRTAARLAMVRGDAAPDAEERHRPANTDRPQRARPADLGPNQLAWLRAKVPSFEICEKLAVESEAHRKALRQAAGLAS